MLQDHKEAVRLYRLAADQGLASAQYNLPDMTSIGNGRNGLTNYLAEFHIVARRGATRTNFDIFDFAWGCSIEHHQVV